MADDEPLEMFIQAILEFFEEGNEGWQYCQENNIEIPVDRELLIYRYSTAPPRQGG
jgi:hypothetical protein